MQPDSSTIEALVTELLLKHEEIPLEEQFLAFLTMEPFVQILRKEGFDNGDILKLCRQIEARKKDGHQEYDS